MAFSWNLTEFFRLSGVNFHFDGLCGGSIDHHWLGIVLYASEVMGSQWYLVVVESVDYGTGSEVGVTRESVKLGTPGLFR